MVDQKLAGGSIPSMLNNWDRDNASNSEISQSQEEEEDVAWDTDMSGVQASALDSMFSADGTFVSGGESNFSTGDLDTQWDMPAEPPKPIPIGEIDGGFTRLRTHTKTSSPQDETLFTPLTSHAHNTGNRGPSEPSWLNDNNNSAFANDDDSFDNLGAFSNDNVAGGGLFSFSAGSGDIWGSGEASSFSDTRGSWGAPKKNDELNAKAKEWQPEKDEGGDVPAYHEMQW